MVCLPNMSNKYKRRRYHTYLLLAGNLMLNSGLNDQKFSGDFLPVWYWWVGFVVDERLAETHAKPLPVL